MHVPEISIVIPTYNSISKMEATLNSLVEASQLIDLEVIFVDDGSTDRTVSYLTSFCENFVNWTVSQLPSNSGSAAAPRNVGIELSNGRYLFFLDSDDVLEPAGLRSALDLALKWDYDVVRTALRVRFGDGSERVSDTVPGWDQIKDLTSKIRAITKHQSLTCSFLMKRSLLNNFQIRFDEGRRIGEDIKFTSKVLSHAVSIGLRNVPSRVYVRTSSGEESVTQKINSAQFLDFVRSWEDVEVQLGRKGVSFLREHGYAAIFYALKQYVWFQSEPLSKEVFDAFSKFCNRHKRIIETYPFIARYQEIIDAAVEGNFEVFNESTRLRMVVAGHDLKFLRELLPKFETIATVRTDQWAGHTQHDEEKSSALLAWADLVWCEWLLGASVWYSRRVRGDQRLVVRAHRSEMTGNYGVSLDWRSVSAFVSVSPHTLGDFSDRFDIPREKFWLIPNAINTSEYEQGELTVERVNRISMIGILPKLKGFKKAIGLLAEAREINPNLEMFVFGKQPEDLDWLMRIDEEREYFDSCRRLITDLGLEGSIQFKGWVDTKKELCQVGFVLSMSDFEGQHLAVAEGFSAGGVGLSLNWRGASQNHPRQFVFDNPEDLRNELVSLISDTDRFQKASEAGRQFVTEMYGVDNVWEKVRTMLLAVRA